MAAPMWKTIPCTISELRLDRTLACGQSFRWKEHLPGVWTGVIGDAVWQLRQTDTKLFYKVYRNITDVMHDPEMSEMTTRSKSEIKGVTGKKKVKYRKSDITLSVDIKQGPVKTDITKEPVKLEITQEPVKLEITQEPVKLEITREPVKLEIRQESDELKITHEPVKLEVNKLSSISTCVKIFKNNEHLTNTQDQDIIADYFQLGINLEDMYRTWSKTDKHFEKISKEFTGIRMLRQDPIECLFSFICSSNNHISRITSMVDKLAEHFGERIAAEHDIDRVEFYAFPKVEDIAVDGVEDRLRELGFGYRAKYIQKSARFIQENGGEEWIHSLRNMEYKEAKRNLVMLCGVGAKVADCVALMSLDQPGSIPVDTHVWQIAARDYMPKLKQTKSLNDKLYDEIGDFFRNLWGPYAGWAHSVLFTADLRKFKAVKKEPPKKAVKRRSDGPKDTRQKCRPR